MEKFYQGQKWSKWGKKVIYVLPMFYQRFFVVKQTSKKRYDYDKNCPRLEEKEQVK